METSNLSSFASKHIHFEELESTNDYLKEHAWEFPHGTIVTARRQVKGKGRLGRVWEDDGDSSLKMSLLLHGTEIEDMPILPSITGIAVCEALSSLYGGHFRIKWPNDVVLHGKKISGILCESRISGKKSFAICGIGINLSQNSEFFEKNGLPFATSIAIELDIQPKIEDITNGVASLFEKYYTIYKQNSFVDLLDICKSRSATLNQHILLQKEGELIECFAEDIGSNGQLICRVGEEILEVQAGEASVRGLYGYV